MKFLLQLFGLALAITTTSGFSLPKTSSTVSSFYMSEPSDMDDPASSFAGETLDDLKQDLIKTCTRSNKPPLDEVKMIVRALEDKAELVGEGQASAVSGLLVGEWELLYSPEDITRSSPFFWAFRKAFPEQSDQIFAITDAIPAPIKEVGPAYQTIDIDDGTQTGKFVSRVKVATLNSFATSIMTTRAAITGVEGIDGIRMRIETTKPEDSTAVKTLLGPLADLVNDALPPFPSGEALEQVQPGSSDVVMKTSFCDEALRISRNGEKYDEIYVWKRKGFAAASASSI